MGFLKQDAPVVDFAEWSKGTRAEKIKPMARHWAEVGFGTPVILHLFYVAKILAYAAVAYLIVASTDGIGFGGISHWYNQPLVFEKVVLFTMLFEVVGLGCGFGPLNNRFWPPMGSILYWTKPGTIRLPPWRLPLTRGDSRTVFDVVLYVALLVLLIVGLASSPSDHGVLPSWEIWALLGVLAVLSLRDKVIFLAARGEVYAPFVVAFLFTSGSDTILAAKLICVTI